MTLSKKLTSLTCWPLFLIIGLAAWSLTAARAKGQTGADTQALNVIFTAKPVKKRFEVGEKVIFSFSLRNNGQQDVAVAGVFVLGYDIYLEITGLDGSNVRSCGAIPKIGIEKLDILHPGEVRKANLDIRCEGEDGLGGYSIEELGRHKVAAEYYTPGEFKRLRAKAPPAATVAKGPFEAEPVEFWLVPKGSEQATPN